MEITRVTKDRITQNNQNPRTISEGKIKQLTESLLSFPEMLYIRPIVMGSEGISLGGNMRLQAIEVIRNYIQPRKVELLTHQRNIRAAAGLTVLQDEKFEEAINHLLFDHDFLVIDVSYLTKEKQSEFIIKDNVSFGEWDWPAVDKLWGRELTTSWGLDMPVFAASNKNDDEPKADNTKTGFGEHVCPECGHEFFD
jgi:hypothetical protein